MTDPFAAPAAFSFALRIVGDAEATAAGFSEVSGLDATPEVEATREGGAHGFVHRLPTRRNRAPLVFRRGLLPAGSPLLAWCRDTLEVGLSTPIAPRDVEITLRGERRTALMHWIAHRAWPVKWSVGGMPAASGEIAVEELEFACDRIERAAAGPG